MELIGLIPVGALLAFLTAILVERNLARSLNAAYLRAVCQLPHDAGESLPGQTRERIDGLQGVGDGWGWVARDGEVLFWCGGPFATVGMGRIELHDDGMRVRWCPATPCTSLLVLGVVYAMALMVHPIAFVALSAPTLPIVALALRRSWVIVTREAYPQIEAALVDEVRRIEEG